MAIPLNNHSSSKNVMEQAMPDGNIGNGFLPTIFILYNENICLPLMLFCRACLWGKTPRDYFIYKT